MTKGKGNVWNMQNLRPTDGWKYNMLMMTILQWNMWPWDHGGSNDCAFVWNQHALRMVAFGQLWRLLEVSRGRQSFWKTVQKFGTISVSVMKKMKPNEVKKDEQLGKQTSHDGMVCVYVCSCDYLSAWIYFVRISIQMFNKCLQINISGAQCPFE